MVIISGDSDFIPVVLNLREKGIRVEIASFDYSMSELLAHRCSGYISLDVVFGDSEGRSDVEAVDDVEEEDYSDDEEDDELTEEETFNAYCDR